MSKVNFVADINEDNKIINIIDNRLLENRPEEHVRQAYLKTLLYDYGYAKNQIAIEVPIYYGSKELKDHNGNPVRADIVVYHSAIACKQRDQGKINFIVECKAPGIEDGYNQLTSYIYNTSASGGVWYNGNDENYGIAYYRRLQQPKNELVSWPGLPRSGEDWDIFGRRKKKDLHSPQNIKSLFKLCHNRLHSRGTEEDDLTMDMVRIILAKARDEERDGEYPLFYCTSDEYNSETGRKDVAKRIELLFNEAKELNNDVFDKNEKISVGERAISEVVTVLQDFRILSDMNSTLEWDLMGAAYEEYTSTYLKKKKGQFFTNRLIVNLLVKMIQPKPEDIILDPAGGSGGFLTGVLRYVRNNIINSKSTEIAKQRQLYDIRTRLYMVEASKRLVKVAKTAMILNGDGHTGMTQGDSLGSFSNFNENIIAKCNKGVPTIILTNPPFAGIGEGKVSDLSTLECYDLGKKWKEEDGILIQTDEIISEGVPPEILFVERCITWLKPGGRLGIVLPKGFLDTTTYYAARQYILNTCKIQAIINLSKNTFQPYTGVRTCLLLLEKYDNKICDDYKIFMAISKKVGQDSEGVPIFKYDENGDLTDELDQDLEEIFEKYEEFSTNKLIESEYCFSVHIKDIDKNIRLNPQAYMPSLNKTLRDVSKIDDQDGWNVYSLSEIDKDIKIFKGPRLKTENLICDKNVKNAELYYTPSAILQDKSDSVKYLDLSKATSKQLNSIKKIRLQRGDIVITRSGSIGRTALITSKHDNVIASDDLIRVRIKNPELRLYVYFYLLSKYAVDQMLLNEYGSVQQHLEPSHIAKLLIPIPENSKRLIKIINSAKEAINAKEYAYKLEQESSDQLNILLQNIT